MNLITPRFGAFKQIISLLPPSFKGRIIVIYLQLILNAVFDIIGLAAILPVIAVILNQNLISNNVYLNNLFVLTGLDSHQSFSLLLSVLLVLLILIKNGLSLLIHRNYARFSYELMKYFSHEQLKKYNAQGFEYYSNTNSNIIVRNINNVPEQFSTYVLLPFLTILTESFVILIIGVSLLIYDFKLIVLLVIFFLPGFLFFYQGAKGKIKELRKSLHILTPKLNNQIFHAVFGFVDMKVANKELEVFQKYKSLNSQKAAKKVMEYVFNLMPTKILESFLMIGLFLIISYGFYFKLSNEYLLSLLTLFAISAYRLMPSVNRVLIALLSIKSHDFTIDVLKEFTSNEIQIEETKKLQKIEKFSSINFSSLDFKYFESDDFAIEDFSLTIKKGERIGIIGKSGSGKSTLVKLLLRFLRPSQGEILVDDKNIEELDLNCWYSLIGYIQQDTYIMDATLAENIAFSTESNSINETKIMKAIKSANLEDYLGSLENGIKTSIGERGAKISGGQKQRVGIARALYQGAKILVLDEATSALDSETESKINETIEELGKSDLTIFVIAHRYTTLNNCDRIIELKNGRIHRTLTYHQLMNEQNKNE